MFIDPFFVAGIVIASIFALLLIIGIIYNIGAFSSDETWHAGWAATFFFALVSVVLCALLTPFGFYPYDNEYKYWSQHSGVVEDIGGRVLLDSGSAEQLVFTLEGSDEQYKCSDSRCALVEPGDTLTLSCIKDWQYTGQHAYRCEFVSVE